MINGDKREDEVRITLELLNGIEPVPPPPFLAGNVMQALARQRGGRAPNISRGFRFAVAGLVALAALNVLTIVHAGTGAGAQASVPSAAADSLARDYRLTLEDYQSVE